jgi:hypothetical protein
MNFPNLKTGAVTQYGSSKSSAFSTQVYRFVDGTEQRFPAFAAQLRRWVIRLSLLDESELTALAELPETFSFTDPMDGATYTARFDSDELSLRFDVHGSTVATIREVRA